MGALAPPRRGKGRCRRCGTPLASAQHVRIDRIDRVTENVRDADGRVRTETRENISWKHILCPRCGDPEPLNSWREKLPGLLVLAALFALFGGLGWLLMSF